MVACYKMPCILRLTFHHFLRLNTRMLKTAFQQGRRRVKTGGVPSGVR